jgi:ParB family chromosome partitioning protein
MSKASLGKGLGALLGNPSPLANPEPDLEKNESIVNIPAGKLVPCADQPRKTFRAEELAELRESIREKGVIQPLIVRKMGQNFEIIAGERRWRAALELKLAVLPAIVREATDQEVLEYALIENLQRAELSPLEEARAYERLIRQFSLTQEDVAKKVGKSRVAIAHSVRLLGLPESLRNWVDAGDLSVGHAKVLLGLDKAEEQVLAADRIRRENLTVRATERLVDSLKVNASRPIRRLEPAKNRVPSDLERSLQHHLGTRVRLVGNAGQGRLELHFYSQADLDRLLKLLGFKDE